MRKEDCRMFNYHYAKKKDFMTTRKHKKMFDFFSRTQKIASTFLQDHPGLEQMFYGPAVVHTRDKMRAPH